MSNYFFSICIPSEGRSETIVNTLKSLCEQRFRNFNVIISVKNNNKNINEKLGCFFSSDYFESKKFDYEIVKYKTPKNEMERWNIALDKATGEYVSKLEGDDAFFPDHLEEAYDYLTKNSDVGIYAASQARSELNINGKFDASEYPTYLCKMNECPPPSQTIFRRKSKSGQPFKYNVNKYTYAPEIDLLIRISLDGMNAYHSPIRSVYRRVSSTTISEIISMVEDRNTVLTEYKDLLNEHEVFEFKKQLASFAIKKTSFVNLYDLYQEIEWSYINFLYGITKKAYVVLQNKLEYWYPENFSDDPIYHILKALSNVLFQSRINVFLSKKRLADIEDKNEDDIEGYIQTVNDYEGYYPCESIVFTQHNSEIYDLINYLMEKDIKTVLELGTKNGGTFYLWAKCLQPEVLVSVDLPGGDFGGGYDYLQSKFFASFADGTKIDCVRSNSHDEQTKEEVRQLLDGPSIDFLFIDGDHTYEGVKQDFYMYKDLVTPGGLIAFHDICYHPSPHVEVKQFWDEIKHRHDTKEFISSERDSFGLGGIGLLKN
jgi:predicted O-methyltransferase YrrM/glycosyltransferase involved in cell wall biosynthesis